MKDIGIRHLKAHASDLVRQVSENHATYTITRRGHAVWDHLEKLMDRIGKSQQTRKSAVRELAKMRR